MKRSRVVVQLIGEDSCHQTFRQGFMSQEEVQILQKFFDSGPQKRIKTVASDPDSEESIRQRTMEPLKILRLIK